MKKSKRKTEPKSPRFFHPSLSKAVVFIAAIALGLTCYRLFSQRQIKVYEERLERIPQLTQPKRATTNSTDKPIAAARLPLSGPYDAEARRLTETLMISTDVALKTATQLPPEIIVRQIAQEYQAQLINQFTIQTENSLIQIFSSSKPLQVEVRAWPNMQNPEFSGPDPAGNPPGIYRGGPLFIIRLPADPPDDEQKAASIFVGNPTLRPEQLPPPLLPTIAPIIAAGLQPGNYRLPNP